MEESTALSEMSYDEYSFPYRHWVTARASTLDNLRNSTVTALRCPPNESAAQPPRFSAVGSRGELGSLSQPLVVFRFLHNLFRKWFIRKEYRFLHVLAR